MVSVVSLKSCDNLNGIETLEWKLNACPVGESDGYKVPFHSGYKNQSFQGAG